MSVIVSPRPLLQRLRTPTAVLWACLATSLVYGQGLPELEDPSRGAGSGIMETLRNYSYDIVLQVALLVVASMFVGICYHAYSTYSEIHTGRKTWASLA